MDNIEKKPPCSAKLSSFPQRLGTDQGTAAEDLIFPLLKESHQRINAESEVQEKRRHVFVHWDVQKCICSAVKQPNCVGRNHVELRDMRHGTSLAGRV